MRIEARQLTIPSNLQHFLCAFHDFRDGCFSLIRPRKLLAKKVLSQFRILFNRSCEGMCFQLKVVRRRAIIPKLYEAYDHL